VIYQLVPRGKWLIVLVLLAMLVAACGPTEAPPVEPTAKSVEPEPVVEEGPFRVAVIMPSAINDLAFSQSIYDALVKIQEEMGGLDKMELVYSESMFVVDDAAAAIRDYAAQGYDLVIAHGSRYGSSLREIGSFSDVTLASEAANTHVAAGAGVLAGTAQMVVGAIGVAEEKSALWFGTQSSQTSLAPGIVVANQVYHWTVVLRDIFNLIAEGTYSGQAHAITLENRGLVMEYNADYALAGDVKTLADETVAGIIDGTISTGTGQ
jgi:basic membrane lipoprotein Med (substrate-binding protein (PBP1-ABC) superfamily)